MPTLASLAVLQDLDLRRSNVASTSRDDRCSALLAQRNTLVATSNQALATQSAASNSSTQDQRRDLDLGQTADNLERERISHPQDHSDSLDGVEHLFALSDLGQILITHVSQRVLQREDLR